MAITEYGVRVVRAAVQTDRVIEFTPRLGWTELPDGVRLAIGAAVAESCGAPVRAATPVTGGFSPGCAVALELDDGRRVFVKATSSELNPDSPRLYARERTIARHLPRAVPAPRLLADVEHDGWIALVHEFVPGHLARFPWVAEEWTAITRSLAGLAAATAPADQLGIPDLRPAADLIAPDFAGWANLLSTPPGDLPDSVAGAVAEGLGAGLDRLAAAGIQALRDARQAEPSVLAHLDVRPDNVLITPEGAAVIVDWPWGCAAPAWFDTVNALISLQHGAFHSAGATAATEAAGRRPGHLDAQQQLAVLPLTRNVDPDTITGVLAGWAGFFLDRARLPAPQGLPTLREFQLSQGLSTLAWVLDRLD